MNIKTLNILSENEVNTIRDLEKICKEHDGIKGSVFLDTSMNSNHEMNSMFLLYEKERLISVLIMFIPTQQEVEISAFTLPSCRGKGHFKVLLSKAKEELKKYEFPEILFVCESQSVIGKQVIMHLSAQYDFTEYSMKLDVEKYVPKDSNRLTYLKPGKNDFDKLIGLRMEVFGEGHEEAQGKVLNSFESGTRDQYLGVLDEKVIGLGSVSHEEDEVMICGFGIVSEFRSKGYGRDLLHLIVESLRLSGETKIMIEVDSNNAHAFHLYQTFGFEIKTALEYYRKNVV